MDLSLLPDWMRRVAEDRGLLVTTRDEIGQQLQGFQFLVIGYATYLASQTDGLADKMRAERRKRSGAADAPTRVEDVDVDSWFDDDAGGGKPS